MIEPHDEYIRFIIGDEYRRFIDTCNDLDRRQAMSQLGYSDRTATYTEVGRPIVPTDTVQAVGAVVSAVVSLLGIDRPEVRWFRHETAADRAHRDEFGGDELEQFDGPDNLAGRALRGDPPAVLIRMDLPVRQAMRTAAHECRHLAQLDPVDLDGYVANEHDARDYEAGFAAAYMAAAHRNRN
ncbi:MAG: hypothetical protein JJT89_00520 [Nitriliruptoraceae bacterium]|nr:hypothetical protein [Nitriliruptoraceae bacterium]